MRSVWLPLVVSAVLVATAAADDQKKDPGRIGNRDVGGGINFYSLEKERALGKQLAEEVERQARLSDDPILSEYINRIGQNLVRNSDARYPFTFRVIEADQPNAFALPGGYIFVHTGLIKMADEEAELAAAMAHEIAHVAARHMTRQATKSQLLSLATVPLSVLLGGWAGYGARQAAGAALPFAALRFSRQDESEADLLGIQYAYAAGYDPAAAIVLFEKLGSLERQKPGWMGRLLSTHPPSGARLANVQRQIEKLLPARPEYVVNTSTYMEIRERVFQSQDETRGKTQGEQPVLRTHPSASGDGPSETGPVIRRRDRVE